MSSRAWLRSSLVAGALTASCAYGAPPTAAPTTGDSLRLVTSTVLEVSCPSTLQEGPKKPLPALSGPLLQILVDGQPRGISRRGCRRRVLDVPKSGPAQVETVWVAELEKPLQDGQKVEASLGDQSCSAAFSTTRLQSALHVNLAGYQLGRPKRFWVGHYLGDLGELPVPVGKAFSIERSSDHQSVARGTLEAVKDRGWPWASPYSQMAVGDFTTLDQAGRYRVVVAGLGESAEFTVGPDATLDWTRTLALGLYHQRCGVANALPFTRYTHGACHTRPAVVPTEKDKAYVENLHGTSGLDPGQLHFPSVQQGHVNVQGGHHDAGDYSKYVVNSARLIHALVLAVDYFPGAASLDQLGLPESGDGHPDLLQEALWEADFVSKMQDKDGGFYFMVYPRTRRYEDNVTPDHGDEQVVFPKSTVSTACCTAALAQCAGSAALRKLDPERARRYRQQAEHGWQFLEAAWKKFGESGAYQKITHYGERFEDKDEIVWAGTELYLLTGDERYSKFLLSHFQPQSPDTRHWGWIRLCESYGSALRHLALADRAGEAAASRLPAAFRAQVRAEVLGWSADLVEASEGCAYGLAFPFQSKRVVRSGWFFPTDAAFDMQVAELIEPSPARARALWSQLDYALGCNPNNLCYLTGFSHAPVEIVSQYARNSWRRLPPDGILVGCVEEGFPRGGRFGDALTALSWPPDNQEQTGYPLLQR